MATQLPGSLLRSAGLTLAGGRSLNCRNSQVPAAVSSAHPPPLSSSTIQIVGWKGVGGSENENSKLCNAFEGFQEEYDWDDLDNDLYHWTKSLRPVQWYPGHIAKTEKELKEQLKLMDVVIEVRDARIPMSTSHPQMESWLGNRKRILVLNREDMISTTDRNAWATYFAKQGIRVVFSNGQLGMGTLKLGRLAKALAGTVNVKRRAKGLLPRPLANPRVDPDFWNKWHEFGVQHGTEDTFREMLRMKRSVSASYSQTHHTLPDYLMQTTPEEVKDLSKKACVTDDAMAVPNNDDIELPLGSDTEEDEIAQKHVPAAVVGTLSRKRREDGDVQHSAAKNKDRDGHLGALERLKRSRQDTLLGLNRN